jgi:branched-chain amino acid transport system substrate-binding protein
MLSTTAVARTACFVGLIVAITIPAAERAISQSLSKEPIKIGLSMVGSGAMADYWGRQLTKPAQLAIDDFNAKGGIGGRMVIAILEDNKGDATAGASVAHKLIDVDKVDSIFIAPTPPTLATLPIAEAAKVLILSAAQDNNIPKSPWGSLVPPVAEKGGVAYFKVAMVHKPKRVALLAVDNQSVYQQTVVFKALAQKAGVEIVAHETFKPNNKDFTAQLTKIRAAEPDQLTMMSFSPAEYGYALKQMQELNFKPKFIGGWNPIGDPQTRQIAGDAVNGVLYFRLPIDDAWQRQFKSRMGYEPDSNAAISYDAITIYLEARAKAATDDPVKIRDAMFNYKGYKGALGAWGFKGNGESDVDYQAAELQPDGTGTKIQF